MKKQIAAVLCVCVLLAGCGAKRGEAFSPVRYFTASFTLTRGDYEFRGALTCNSCEDIRLTFDYPEGMRYFTVRISSEGYLTETDGVPDGISAEELPAAAPVAVLGEALRKTVFAPCEFTKNEYGGYTAVIQTGGQTAETRFSPDGRLLAIECAAAELRVTFEDYKEL